MRGTAALLPRRSRPASARERPTRRSPMRQLAAMVCVLIAVVAALVTVPMAWVATHVADEDGYVSFSSPLGSDHELQRAFSAYLSDQLVTTYHLPEVVRPQASAALTVAARAASNAPGYTQAWQETQ